MIIDKGGGLEKKRLKSGFGGGITGSSLPSSPHLRVLSSELRLPIFTLPA